VDTVALSLDLIVNQTVLATLDRRDRDRDTRERDRDPRDVFLEGPRTAPRTRTADRDGRITPGTRAKTQDFLAKVVKAGYATPITLGVLHRGRLFRSSETEDRPPTTERDEDPAIE
jgi:hypothetical protein